MGVQVILESSYYFQSCSLTEYHGKLDLVYKHKIPYKGSLFVFIVTRKLWIEKYIFPCPWTCGGGKRFLWPTQEYQYNVPTPSIFHTNTIRLTHNFQLLDVICRLVPYLLVMNRVASPAKMSCQKKRKIFLPYKQNCVFYVLFAIVSTCKLRLV